jgi:hypothetical protein
VTARFTTGSHQAWTAFHLSLQYQHLSLIYSSKPSMEHEIDGWIEQLSQCKQLSEADVKSLCDKVDNRATLLFFLFLVDLTMYGSIDKRDPDGRIKCSACEMSGHRLWRYPWSIRAFRCYLRRATPDCFNYLPNRPPIHCDSIPVSQSSMIFPNFSALAETRQTPTTFSWAITSTVDTTPLRQ